jgi:hypothetical protein
MMRNIYYVLDSIDSDTKEKNDLTCIYLNANQQKNVIENKIDMTLLDYLHEPCKIVFVSKLPEYEHVAQKLAELYGASYTPNGFI